MTRDASTVDDASGSLASETRGGSRSGDSWTASYDDERRLTAWDVAAGDDESWTLSAVGDWDAYARGSVGQARTHGGAHELTQITESGTALTLTYDARGNLTADALRQGPNTGRTCAPDAGGVSPKRPDRGRPSPPV